MASPVAVADHSTLSSILIPSPGVASMSLEIWMLVFTVVQAVAATGCFAFILKMNYKWNTMQDRNDLLYNEYCKAHNIPFVGLRNDFD